MSQAFNKVAFEAAFAASLIALAASEKVTREELRMLSRTVLEAVHATGDIGYVNKLLPVLSPMNRKTCVVFMKHFTGFSYDDTTLVFTKKSKKRYDDALAAAIVFLEDPLNNIWSWAERNVVIEQKAFNLNEITEYTIRTIKKAEKNNLKKADVLKAVIGAGFTVEDLVAVLETMADVEVKVEG